MANDIVYRAQVWLADNGYGQYPREIRPRPGGYPATRQMPGWLKFMTGVLGLFIAGLMIVIGLVTLYACYQLATVFVPMLFGK